MRDAQISDSSTDEYLKTYNIIHLGEMIFEGHSSKEYKSGRFVVNDYRPGIVSHVFDVFQFKKKKWIFLLVKGIFTAKELWAKFFSVLHPVPEC